MNDSLPSQLVHKELVWLYEIKEEIDNSKDELNDNIPKLFPEHEFEPLNWNDTLATMDVCTNIYATRHCNEEGYDIMFQYMVKVIFEDEEMGKYSSQGNELILEGLEMDTSQVNPIIQEVTMQNVPLMPEKMKQMSIQDFKVQEESEADSEAEFDQEHKFLDALVKYLAHEEVKMVLAKTIGLAYEESNKEGHNMEFQEPQTRQNV